MGGIGGHPTLHPWFVQNIAFLFTLLFPAAALILIVGAMRERALRYGDAAASHRRRQIAYVLYRRGLRRISQAISALYFF
jgi:hypothetical protein